jgi:hypothetical protein
MRSSPSIPARGVLIAIAVLLAPAASAQDGQPQPSLGIGLEVRSYPHLVRIAGSPVFRDPRAAANYFFYDGLFWVYRDDAWYSSAWYNGPWQGTEPDLVPLFVLRIPLRYYRQRPEAFAGWRPDAPPRWSERFGRAWAGRHPGWERVDPREVPPPAPLPVYQQQFRGERYPQGPEEQHDVRTELYRHEPLEAITRERFEPRDLPQPTRTASDDRREAPVGRRLQPGARPP